MIDKLIETYLALRDKKTELDRIHDEAIAPIKAGMAKIENHLLTQMQAQGLTSFPVKGVGTAYQSLHTSVTMADWDSYRPFIEEQPDPFRFLDRKVNKTAVEEYMAEHQDVPPGVNVRREIVVNVRRS